MATDARCSGPLGLGNPRYKGSGPKTPPLLPGPGQLSLRALVTSGALPWLDVSLLRLWKPAAVLPLTAQWQRVRGRSKMSSLSLRCRCQLQTTPPHCSKTFETGPFRPSDPFASRGRPRPDPCLVLGGNVSTSIGVLPKSWVCPRSFSHTGPSVLWQRLLTHLRGTGDVGVRW